MEQVVFIAEYMGHKPALSKPKEGYYLARRILLTEACFIQKVDEVDVRSGNIPVSPDKVLLGGAFYAVTNLMCVAVAPHTRVIGTCSELDFAHANERSPLWHMIKCDYTEAATALEECKLERRAELSQVVAMSERLFEYFCFLDFDTKAISIDAPVTIDISMTLNGVPQHPERIELKERGQNGLESALFIAEHWRYIASELQADAYTVEVEVDGKRALKYDGEPKKEGSTDGAVPGLEAR